MTIEGLKQTDVDTHAQNELDRGMAIKTVNNQLAVLSTLIKYTTGVKSKLRFKLDGMVGEIHAVATADVEKLLEACDDERYVAVILLASEAGLRAAEIRGLQWNDIKAEQITVRRSLDKMTNEAVAPKHNKTRTIPMSRRLAASLASLPRRGLWVIAEADGTFVTYDRMIDVVHAVYSRAEVARPPKALHCLRHTFGTVMARKVPLPVLQKLMGHSDIQTTLRYVDVNEDEKREAIAAVFGAPGAGVQATRKQETEPREAAS
jgi:integrase